MSDDLKARIEKFAESGHELPHTAVFLTAVSLLEDCLKRIEHLEAELRAKDEVSQAMLKRLSVPLTQDLQIIALQRRIEELELRKDRDMQDLCGILTERDKRIEELERDMLSPIPDCVHDPIFYSQACPLCATEIERRLQADLEVAESTIRRMCGASVGSYPTQLRDAYFQAKEKR
jgi:DNA repair exonuclease SbcCD ATPase subunit